MPDTNMNLGKSPFEFSLPLNELDAQFAPGEVGTVLVPVEVIEVGKETVTFRKRGKASQQMSFQKPTIAELEQTLPIAER